MSRSPTGYANRIDFLVVSPTIYALAYALAIFSLWRLSTSGRERPQIGQFFMVKWEPVSKKSSTIGYYA